MTDNRAGTDRRKSMPNERIAILETKVEMLNAQLDEINDKTDNINKKTDDILKELTRYKGFIGGIMFILSGGYIVWQMAGDFIKKAFQ